MTPLTNERTSPAARRRISALAAGAVALLLAGCAAAAPDLSAFADARAKLDHNTQQIELPLDRYLMSDTEMRLIEHANAVRVDECMEQAGLDYPAADGNWSAIRPSTERPYGLWSVESAAQLGYGVPTDPALEQINASGSFMTTEWAHQLDQCFQTADQLPLLVSGIVDSVATDMVAVSARGETEAHSSAMQDPAWREAREDWWACLREQGLTPLTGDTEWGPEAPSDLEGQIRVAVIDTECKEQSDLVQRLGDVEARYQAAFIESHEAALLEQRAQVDEVIAEAKSIIGVG